MIDLGADLARLVHAEAQAAAGSDGQLVLEATVAFDRVARTVRRTVMLAMRLDEPVRAGPDRVAARKRIIREVEDAIQRAPGEGGEDLEGELLERLDSPDLDDDIAGRPVAEIVADILRDLGLAAMPGTRPWKRRRPEDVALLQARAERRTGGDAVTPLLHAARFRGK